MVTNVVELKQAGVDGRKQRKQRTVKSADRRTAWATLTEKEMQLAGSALLGMLYQTANERGHQLMEMAQELNVTYGYIAQLKNGIRKIPHISEEFAENCAKYLGIPRISVLIAAEKLRPADFYQDPDELETMAEPALRLMQKDPEFGPYMPASVFQADRKLQQFLVMMYERATGRVLLKHKVDVQDVISQLTPYLKGDEAAKTED